MLAKLLAAWVLVGFCVTTHAAGVAFAARWLRRRVQKVKRPLQWMAVFTRLAAWIIVLHLIEISAFAALYAWRGAMPDVAAAVYFSAVTYTTTGYGDLVLPSEWRLVGAIEALTGILMCGWSTGFFVTVVNRMFEPTRKALESES